MRQLVSYRIINGVRVKTAFALTAFIGAEIGLAAADNRIATVTASARQFRRSSSTLSRAVENLRRRRKNT
jgi:hypothetical protein